MDNLRRNFVAGILLLIGSPIFFCILLLCLSFGVVLPQTIEAEKALRLELESITTPEWVFVEQTESSHDEGGAFAYDSLYSNSSTEEVFHYYDEQLKKRGWVFRKEENFSHLTARYYCKGNFSAEVKDRNWSHYEVALQAGALLGCPLIFDEYFLTAVPFDY